MEKEKFTLYFYDEDGRLVAEESVVIEGNDYQTIHDEALKQASSMLEDFGAESFSIY
jgi:hypothetical protein